MTSVPPQAAAFGVPFEHLPGGVAYCRMIFADGRPSDFLYLYTNPAFTAQTGLGPVVGRCGSEVAAGTQGEDAALLQAYGRVTLTGRAEKFEMFVGAFRQWFSVLVYRPFEAHFVVIFEHITERKSREHSDNVRYEGLIKSMAEGMVVQARDGSIVAANPAAERILGQTFGQIMGVTAAHAVCAVVDENGRALGTGRLPAAEVLQTGQAQHDRLLGIDCPAHGRRWIKVNAVPLFVEGLPKPDAVLTTFEDVTRQRTTELALRESEQRFRGIFEKSSSVMLLIDPESGTILDANAAAFAFYGYAADQLIGMPISDINTLSAEAVAQERRHALAEERKVFRFEHRLATGELRHVEVYSTPVPVQQKHLLFSIIHDVTERTVFALRLHEKMQELNTILDSAGVGISFVKDRVQQWANPRMAELFGYVPEAMVGCSTRMFFGSEAEFDALGEQAHPALSAGRRFVTELRMRHKDGQLRWMSLAGKAVNPQHLEDGSIWVFEDISTRKQAEERLLSVQEGLQASHDLLQKLSQNVPGAIYQYKLHADGRSTFPYSSEGLLDVYEVAPADVVEDASVVLGRLHEQDLPAVVSSIQASAQSLQDWALHYRVKLPRKGIRWLAGHARPERLDDGSTLWHGFISDITERKAAELALAESEMRFRVLAETSAAGIFVLQGRRIVFANRSLLELIGCDEHEALGLDFVSLVLPQLSPAVPQTFGAPTVPLALPSRQEFLIRTRRGDERWVELTSGAIEYGGQPSSIGTVFDVTRRKHDEQALRASEAFATATMDAVSAHICVLDRHGLIVAVNRAWRAHASRQEPGAVVVHGGPGTDYLQACQQAQGPNAEEARAVAAGIAKVMGGELQEFALEYPCEAPGELQWFVVRVTRFHAGTPNVVLAHENITSRKLGEARLQLAAKVFTHAGEGMVITDTSGTIVDVNEAFTRITGYSRHEALRQSTRMLKSGRQGPEFYAQMWSELKAAGYWRGEVWNRRKDGEVYAEMLTISAVRDEAGATLNYLAIFSDITPIKEHARRLERIAHYDALTNLPNRVLLADRLQHAIDQCQRRGLALTVLYLDLDGFKAVNDQHGHAVGDSLLVEVSKQMKAALRAGDTLARIGGDEFVAVLVDLERPEAFVPVIERMMRACAEPVTIGGAELRVTASIGVAIYPQDGVSADQLLRQADQAMYQSKQSGKNCYQFFDPSKDLAIKSRRESLERMQLALQRNEFVLRYQPKVNMRTGRVIGMEALIRWQHPVHGILPPVEFLPVIEDHPLSVALGDWVIRSAILQMSQWRAQGLAMPVSVNVGALQLERAEFADKLKTALAEHAEVPPSDLQLEILETSALHDTAQVSDIMRRCQQLGVRFALDDFGTGYASLSYLKQLPAETLKIDQSFVLHMLDGPNDRAIVRGIIGLATAFGREVLAEGVETLAMGTELLRLGCELAQGYAIARPMSAWDVPRWVRAWEQDSPWCGHDGDAGESTAPTKADSLFGALGA